MNMLYFAAGCLIGRALVTHRESVMSPNEEGLRRLPLTGLEIAGVRNRALSGP